MLVTTGRKPCRNTRVFARTLSGLLPCSEYTVRGKKSVDELVELARSEGQPSVAIVSDMKGNPGRISFIRLGAEEWDWLPEELVIRSAAAERTRVAAGDISFEGDERIAGLFGIEPAEDSDVLMKASKDEMVLSYQNKTIIKMRYSLEVGKHGGTES